MYVCIRFSYISPSGAFLDLFGTKEEGKGELEYLRILE